MLLLLAGWLLLAGCTETVPEAAPIDELVPLLRDGGVDTEQFTRIYAAAVSHHLPRAAVTVAAELELTLAVDGATIKTRLDDFWHSYEVAPDLAGDDLGDLVASLQEIVEHRAAQQATTADVIVPVVRSAAYLEAIREQVGATADLAAETLAGDLWVLYAADSEHGMRFLAWAEIEAAGVARSALRHRALENLSRILPDVERTGDGPFYMLTAGANYVASLLLLDAMWESYAALVEGPLVVAVPTRDVLLFTGAASAEGIAGVQAGVDKVSAGPHSLSPTLFERRDGLWVPR